MKLITTTLVLLAAVFGFAQVNPMDLPDSEFDVVRYVYGGSGETISGDYTGQTVRIRVSNARNLKIENLILDKDSEVTLAGCSGHSVKYVKIGENSLWHSFPVAVDKSRMRNAKDWWSATNGAYAIQDDKGWKHNFQQNGWEDAKIIVQKKFLKRGFDVAAYSSIPIRLRDVTGKIFNGKVMAFKDLGDTIEITVSPKGTMTKGVGYWTIYDPTQFQKNLVYDNFQASGHRFVSFYFADGVTFKNGKLYGARVDYNLGFENCANVNLHNVLSSGNMTEQGGKADVAFIFGIRGLKASGNQIASFQIASKGWECDNVNVDQPIHWVEQSWVGRVIEEGVVRPPVGS